jgi:hypothetical protein
LTQGTLYATIVTAVNAYGSTASSPLNITTQAFPGVPTSLSSNTITASAFTVTWTPGTNTSSYTYTLNGTTATPSSSTSTSATFTGLTQGTLYATIVTAVNAYGSTPSSPLNVTTQPVPGAPTSLASSSITTTAFTVSWTPGGNTSSYTYTLNGSSVSPSSSTSTSATFTGLTQGTLYATIVTAVNAYGTTASSPLNVTTLAPPTAVTGLTSSNITPVGFTVSWSGGVGATSYTYTLGGNTVTPSIDIGVSGKIATLTGLSAGTTYSVTVTAVNVSGTTSSSPLSVTTTTLPTTPVVTASNINIFGFTVSWTGGAGATAYTYTLNGANAIPSTDSGIASQTAIFTNLNSGTTYSVIVNAVNTSGSVASTAVVVVTLTPPSPSQQPYIGENSAVKDSSSSAYIATKQTRSVFSNILARRAAFNSGLTIHLTLQGGSGGPDNRTMMEQLTGPLSMTPEEYQAAINSGAPPT